METDFNPEAFVKEAQEKIEQSIALVSSIKDAAERFKNEGRIEDANFAEKLASLQEEATQLTTELVTAFKCDIIDGEGQTTDKFDGKLEYFEEFRFQLAKKFSGMIVINPELYAELTGVEISNEEVEEHKEFLEEN